MLAAMKAAVLSIAMAACRASQPAPPPVTHRVPVTHHAPAPPVDAAVDAAPMGGAAVIAKLEQFADAMCGCPDRDCADHVVEDMTEWAQDLAQAGEASPRVNSAEDGQARAAADRVSRCMSEVYRKRAGSGSPPVNR